MKRILTTLLLLTWVTVAQAEQRVALVIGNGAYDDAPLRNPPNDARAMACALRECGFEVIEKINSDQRTMAEAIRTFGQKIQRGGVGLFYYAGHGMQVQGTNYLIPVGAKVKTEDEVQYEAVDAGRVLSKMEAAGNRLNIIILDACRNNPFARSFRSADRGLKKMDAPKGSLLAYATSPGGVAADGDGQNGLYTSKLLKHMDTPGVAVEQVFKRVRDEVMKATGDDQVPWESTSLRGEFFFVPITPDVVSPAPGPIAQPPSAVQFGHLQVTVSGPQSRVYVNDEYRGKASSDSSLNLRGMGLGGVAVRIEAEGYEPISQNYVLKANQWTQAIFHLGSKEEMIRKQLNEIDKKIDSATNWQSALFANVVFVGLSGYDLRNRDEHSKWRNILGWTGLTIGLMADLGWIIQLADLDDYKREREQLQKQLDTLAIFSDDDIGEKQDLRPPVYVLGESVNLRSGPGADHVKVSQAMLGDKMNVIGGQEGWLKVFHQQDTVWVYEELTGDLAQLAQIQNEKDFEARREQATLNRKKKAGERTRKVDEAISSGQVVFTEDDFYWDKKTSPHKKTIIAGVNKIHRENARCKTIDPTSAYISSNKGTPSDPVFFVTCGTGAGTFNAFFSKSEIEKGTTMAAAKHIDRNRAIDLCEAYAKDNATHPSTVSFSRVMDLAVTEHPNGRTSVTSSFTAKNSFDLKLNYNIRCLCDATGLIEGNISEAQ